jgi:TP901 family phage tail tape measure protein
VAVANVDVRVDSSSAVRNLQQLDTASRRSQVAIDGLTSRVMGLGAALAGGIAIQRVIRDATELDRNIRRLGTVGMDVAKINPALSKLSDQLGGVANKADLAAASYQAASAGFADTAGNVQILNAATKAAVGGLADTQAVTEVLVKTLNAYGMSGTRAFEVTDSISKAVELGNQEWSDYTSLLGRVVSTTALAGVSINEMNAFIASATKNGATAEVAFTGLGAVLNTLLQPTKESQEAAKKLGIQWNYGGLQAKGLTGLMAQLAVAMEKDKETTARLLGSQEAMRGAFAANAKGGKDFVMVLEQLSGAAGKTDADFQTMKGSLENTIKALDTSFMNLSEALAKAFGPTVVITIQDITKSVNGFAKAMGSIPQPVMDTVGTLIKFGIQMMLVKRAIDAVIALRAAYVAATTAMAASTAATGTAATTSSGAFALYTRNTQALAAQATASTAQVTALGAALRNLAAIGIITIGIQMIVSTAIQAGQEADEINRLTRERLRGGMAREFGGAGATPEQKNRARKTIEQINDELKTMKDPLREFAQEVPGFNLFVPTNVDDVARRRLLAERKRRAQAVVGMSERQDPLRQALGKLPTAPAPGGGGAGSGKAKDKKDDAAKVAAAKEAIAASRLQLSQARALFDIEGRILEARGSGNRQLEITRQTQAELLRINFEAQRLKQDKEMPAAQKKAELDQLAIKAATAARQLEFDITAARKEAAETQRQADQDRFNALQAAIEKQYEMNTAIQQQLQFADSVASSIGQGMTSAFDALIRGSDDWGKSLQSIASGVLVDIANQLIKIYVIEQAINAIKTFLTPFAAGTPIGAGGGQIGRFGTFGPNYGIPQFANGGSIKANQLSLVGERGPELFMPGRSGTIIPNHNLGGGAISVVVNVDASGSSVTGDQTQGKQLGMAVSAAVQAELLKQKRPGGLLA